MQSSSIVKFPNEEGELSDSEASTTTVPPQFATQSIINHHSSPKLPLLLWLLMAPVALLPIALFSRIGWGIEVYGALSVGSSVWKMLVTGGLSTLLALYLLDISYWDSKWHKLRTGLLSGAGVVLLVAAILSNTTYAAAPFSVYIYLIPVYFALIRKSVYREITTPLFLRTLALVYSSWGIIVGIIWTVWLTGSGDKGAMTVSHWWNSDLRNNYAQETCLKVDPHQDPKECLAALILWGSPFASAVLSLLFSLIALLLAKTIDHHLVQETDVLSDISEKRRKRLCVILSTASCALMLMLFCVWVAASIAGADMGVSNMVAAFGAVGMTLLAIVLSQTFGWECVCHGAQSVPLVRKVQGLFSSDWMKAGFVIGVWPFILVYLFVSSLNQCVRRITPVGRSLDTARHDPNLWLTKVVHTQLQVVQEWHPASVLTKIAYWDIGIVTLLVGVGKIVTIALAELNAALSSTSYGSVVVIFWLVGLTMFLLPPVPGVPVYLAGGVILVHAGQVAGYGFSQSCLYACFICFGIKLNAIYIQQQGIGARLKHRVWVRSTVAINSLSIRAIKHILEQPGIPFLDIKKVSILCGGPDWPVSVLTGILGQNPIAMLVGSLPVILVITPTCLAGAFALKKGEGEQWESVAKVTLAAAVFAQTSALMCAAYFIEQTASTEKVILQSQPDDREVLELESRNREKQTRYRGATAWGNLPRWIRLLLCFSVLLLTVSMYAVQFMGGMCFRSFEVSGDIDTPYTEGGLDGSLLNIVRPEGWKALITFGIGLLFLQSYRMWLKRRVISETLVNKVVCSA